MQDKIQKKVTQIVTNERDILLKYEKEKEKTFILERELSRTKDSYRNMKDSLFVDKDIE